VFDYGPDAVIVVSAASVSRLAAPPTSLGDALGRLVENVARYSVYSSYEHARAMNTVIQQAPDAPLAQGKKQVDLLLIEPKERQFRLTGLLDFSRDAAHDLMCHGREQAGQALRDWPETGLGWSGS
jgi:hypothetical protein